MSSKISLENVRYKQKLYMDFKIILTETNLHIYVHIYTYLFEDLYICKVAGQRLWESQREMFHQLIDFQMPITAGIGPDQARI